MSYGREYDWDWWVDPPEENEQSEEDRQAALEAEGDRRYHEWADEHPPGTRP